MPSRVRADVTGDRELIRDLLKLGQAGIELGKSVLGEATQRIARKARTLAPVEPEDGGALRDSIRVTKPLRTKAGVISAGIVAGGPPLARLASEKGHKLPGLYAIVQHEDMTFRHTAGQAKFIEQPYLEEAPSVPNALLAALDKVANG